MTLHDLTAEVLAFRDERDWAQFHTPENLASALSIEVAELQEVLLWKKRGEVLELVASQAGHGRLSDEIADVLIFALLFCEAAGIDPEAAVRKKLEKNAERYPVGRARKYTELEDQWKEGDSVR